MDEIKIIKKELMEKFNKALKMELPLHDIIKIGKVVADFERNEVEAMAATRHGATPEKQMMV